MKDAVIFGFDSAWTDKYRGAICALEFGEHGYLAFHEPVTAYFSDALSYISARRGTASNVLVAIDQPTIIPNDNGMRPVERVAGSVLYSTGSAVQPANRSKEDMFGEGAPIWRFKERLRACDDAMRARSSDGGTYLIEVYPALALAGLHDAFAKPEGAPKYNPKGKKFSVSDWSRVVCVAMCLAKELGLTELADWCDRIRTDEKPTKSTQDCLDAAICAMVGYLWQTGDARECAQIGDLKHGYMVTPVSRKTRDELSQAAKRKEVPIRLMDASNLKKSRSSGDILEAISDLMESGELESAMASEYLRTNAGLDVLASLESCADNLLRTKKSDGAWKWVVLTMHSALQGAMVCHLSGSEEVGALTKRSANQWIQRHRQRQETENAPERRLASAPDLLRRLTNEKSRLENSYGGIISVTPTQREYFERLHALRNEFTHFPSQSWSIEIAYIEEAVKGTLEILERIAADTWPFRDLPDKSRGALKEQMKEIRERIS